MKVIYLIRGLPGSGKSTLACKITPHHFEADDYFMVNGLYCYNRDKIYDAHLNCQESVEFAMNGNAPNIAVSNTFVRRWELEPYYRLAKSFNYQIIEVVCKGNFKSIHNIPEEVMERMRLGWEN